jgi:hypothetical protein
MIFNPEVLGYRVLILVSSWAAVFWLIKGLTAVVKIILVLGYVVVVLYYDRWLADFVKERTGYLMGMLYAGRGTCVFETTV